MAYLNAKDVISGQEGVATANIDGNVEVLAYLKKIEATAKKEKTELKTLGKRGTQHKANGFSGEGSMTIYYITSLFRKMMKKYASTGVDTYFDITITNNDPTSGVGKQTTILRDCNIDSILIANLDVEQEALEEDVDFTFSDFEIIDEFKKI